MQLLRCPVLLRPCSGEQAPFVTVQVARANDPGGTTAMWVRDRPQRPWREGDFIEFATARGVPSPAGTLGPEHPHWNAGPLRVRYYVRRAPVSPRRFPVPHLSCGRTPPARQRSHQHRLNSSLALVMWLERLPVITCP
jgi:hypothetical protein